MKNKINKSALMMLSANTVYISIIVLVSVYYPLDACLRIIAVILMIIFFRFIVESLKSLTYEQNKTKS